MNVLVIGGKFDKDGGHRSDLITEFTDAIINAQGHVTYFNGGRSDNLKRTLNENAEKYEAVFWWPSISDTSLKLRNVKEVAPDVLLISCERNDNGQYSFKDFLEPVHADMMFGVQKTKDGKYNMSVYDSLGICWYEGDDINCAARAALYRLEFFKKKVTPKYVL